MLKRTNPDKRKTLCRDFANGRCGRGIKCWFGHPCNRYPRCSKNGKICGYDHNVIPKKKDDVDDGETSSDDEGYKDDYGQHGYV